MEIFYILLGLLIITRTFGELMTRVGQPALLGELIAGILLGLIVSQYPGAFPFTVEEITGDRVFIAITDLGIFFLMLLGGIELRPTEMARASGKALLVAGGGMVLPLALGFWFGWYTLPDSDYKFAQALFIGTALAITAVPVSIKVLMDLGKLESRMGNIIVSAAVIDDVLSLILLAVLTAVIRTGTMPDLEGVLLLVGKVGLFFVLVSLIGHYLFPILGRWLKKTRAEEFEFSMLLVAALGFAVLAEVLGMHFILGAFVAGLFFRRRTIDQDTYEDLQRKTRGLTTGFLAPLFFGSIGLHMDISALLNIPGYVFMLIAIAILGKLIGAGLPARLTGLSNRESLAIGYAMNARGAVELVIADIALRANLFALPEPPPPEVQYLFSTIVIMAIVTTVMTPPAVKYVLRGD